MADVFEAAKRAAIMSHVRGQHTRPERLVRSLLHHLGYRFRLHVRTLPGTPDIVLARYRSIVLVHGCFWHSHPGCSRAKRPATNVEFWSAKLDRNAERDRRVENQLRADGWRLLVVWQCQTRDIDALSDRLIAFLADRKG